MKWGLWDSMDRCWLGDPDGPITYDDPVLGRIAAEVVAVQLGWTVGRVKSLPVDSGAIRYRDEVEVRVDPGEALRRLEEGEV